MVVDGVPAQYADPCFGRLVAASSQDLPQEAQGQASRGKADDVEGEQGAGAFSIDVAQRVGRGDSAEVVAVVDDGSDEVDAGNEAVATGQTVGGRVLRAVSGEKDVRVGNRGQKAQNLRQVIRTYLARSPGTVGEGGELELKVR